MKISHEKPFIFNILTQTFGVKWEAGVAIAYGDTIHCFNGIGPDVVAHESVHLRRQKELGPEEWWIRYIEDKHFRMIEEIEAYRVQIRWLKDNVKEKPLLMKCIKKIQEDFGSPMYGFKLDPITIRRMLR